MYREILILCLLVAAVLVSGCVQTDTGSQQGAGGDSISPGSDMEALAYDQIEQELDEATDNLDIEDLENEMLY